jgi:hypothetical protein
VSGRPQASYADKDTRSAAFKAVNERFGFTAYDMHKFA